MSVLERIKDPYAVYLAFALGWSPSFENRANLLLAAKLGQEDYRLKGEPMSRQALMDKIRALNSSPQNPPKIKARDLFVEVVDGNPPTLQSPRPVGYQRDPNDRWDQPRLDPDGDMLYPHKP